MRLLLFAPWLTGPATPIAVTLLRTLTFFKDAEL